MPGNPVKTRFAAVVGAWIDAACSIVKVAVGFISGSYALIADAAHSATDFVTDLAVVFGAKYWSAPPDDGHPYGHGKIESLVVLFMSTALFAAAGGICYAVFGRGSAPDPLAGVVAFSTAVVKAGLAIWTFRTAALAGSSALKANAWHHMSDALSSIPVAVAVFMSSACPRLAWLDSIAAVLVAAIVAKTAWSFAKSAVLELADADVLGTSKAVAALAAGVTGVLLGDEVIGQVTVLDQVVADVLLRGVGAVLVELGRALFQCIFCIAAGAAGGTLGSVFPGVMFPGADGYCLELLALSCDRRIQCRSGGQAVGGLGGQEEPDQRQKDNQNGEKAGKSFHGNTSLQLQSGTISGILPVQHSAAIIA